MIQKEKPQTVIEFSKGALMYQVLDFMEPH